MVFAFCIMVKEPDIINIFKPKKIRYYEKGNNEIDRNDICIGDYF